MSIVISSQSSVNSQIDPIVDAAIDATDTGHKFGYEDATEGWDQRPSAYFVANTPAWHAYNAGYKLGCIHLAVLTGQSRRYWEAPALVVTIPVAGDYRCQHCGAHFDPTTSRTCPNCGK